MPWLTEELSRIKCKYVFVFVLISSCLLWAILLRTNKNVHILIWWTPFLPGKERTIHCYNDGFQCLVTSDRRYREKSKAFLFYGSHLQPHDVPLPRTNSLWAIFHEESPKNQAAFLFQEMQSLFNITATFSRQSSFPLTLQYLPSLDNITDTAYYTDTHTKNSLLKILAPILYIQSNCDTPVQRDTYVTELMRYFEIDSYGQCLNNKKLPAGLLEKEPLNLFDEEIIKLTAKYKFTLAIENAICDDYITEKLWRPLMAGSVPIYLGSPSIEDWLPNNKSAILMKNYKSVEELAAYINSLNNDDILYEQYMEHKVKKAIKNTELVNMMEQNRHKDSLISQFECFVCKNVHQSIVLKNTKGSVFDCPTPLGNVSDNAWVSHWILGKCQSKTFRSLVEKNLEFTKEDYERDWSFLYGSGEC